MNSLVILAISGIAWLIWRAARSVFIRSPIDNVPGPTAPSLMRGNLGQLLNRDGWEFLDEVGQKYNKVVKLKGLFGHRMLYVFDPKALHQVVIKEADIYDLPEWLTDGVKLTTGPGLLGVHGAHHRRQRKMLNPAFSIKHMRTLTPLFYGVAHRLRSAMETQVGDVPTTINMVNWFSRTALELIGQGGLGYSLDSLDTPMPNPYGEALKQFLPALFANAELQFLLKHVKKIGSPAFRSAMIDWLPLPDLQRLKKVVSILGYEARNLYFIKKKALQAGGENVLKQVGEGKDIMSILMQANMQASEEDRLTEDELIGQMSLLVQAGTDTTSNALTMLIHILAEHPNIQDKLRSEIQQAKEQYGEDIPYDNLVSLPYMDALCRETLRLFPPVSFIFRETRKDVIMPLSEAIAGVDGTTMTEIPVPAGTTVIIGIRAVNHSKNVWGDDVKEFKPERWLSPLPATVMEAHIPGVYSNLMTFNGGGRACIGFKFSQLEMKVVLATIVSSFKISLADVTKDVVWNLAGVYYPTVGKYSNQPGFPVTLERIQA